MPNDADNMTPISDTGGGIAAGDDWVQANLSAYATWAQANNSLLIVTFDENNTDPAVTYPNHIATIVVGAGSANDSPATASTMSGQPTSPGLTCSTALSTKSDCLIFSYVRKAQVHGREQVAAVPQPNEHTPARKPRVTKST
jgi:hypothetical protein